MLNGSEDKANARADLSALADGELDAAATAATCANWRDDSQARASWHAYQLIGDVMRSDELASGALNDSRFLLQLRGRLAAEPAVLAPRPIELRGPDRRSAATATRRSGWSWMAPAAVAAGFMAVASVLVVTGMVSPIGDAVSALAQAVAGKAVGPAATAPRPGEATALAAAMSGEPQTFVADGKLVRDAHLSKLSCPSVIELSRTPGFLVAISNGRPGLMLLGLDLLEYPEV